MRFKNPSEHFDRLSSNPLLIEGSKENHFKLLLEFLSSFKVWIFVCLLTMLIFSFKSYATVDIFLAKREHLKFYYHRPNVVMIASMGRSGSTMLTQQVQKYMPSYQVLKAHLLPPEARFKGKILFIYSNPHQATQSALYMTFHYRTFGADHFKHVETADREWLKRTGNALKQTDQDNLLSYDALGVYEHLNAWLYTKTEPTDLEHAQILAIKYEHLWDKATIDAIRNFLKIDHFELPGKTARGHSNTKALFPNEIQFRKKYNLGTEKEPRYAVYDAATLLWEQAPPFQYLKIKQLHPAFSNMNAAMVQLRESLGIERSHAGAYWFNPLAIFNPQSFD